MANKPREVGAGKRHRLLKKIRLAALSSEDGENALSVRLKVPRSVINDAIMGRGIVREKCSCGAKVHMPCVACMAEKWKSENGRFLFVANGSG